MPFTSESAREAGSSSTRKGMPNKTTQEIKEAYQLLVENNLENMSAWLQKIGEDNPEKAFDVLIKMSDFVIPKLSRQELKVEQDKLTPEEKDQRIEQLKKKLLNNQEL
ncbi:hypothetical protein FHG64_16025 [Antarcticibacterium flavum]|uniref:Uncharacterized protein n=1 Tax=Antarcticibacterium flavum TaxID=2058175 RepID=A0A5B7X5Q3_9FLAO|nr:MULTISPECIES: hypothetical protein [Antarcticibacterium]MCM4161871.1 hypothetical protein [Antarcticibacterium sp. W02-3]QCY70776.1 hypothetical protein FHG64_16025 [Antarcticibacterium flavum]